MSFSLASLPHSRTVFFQSPRQARLAEEARNLLQRGRDFIRSHGHLTEMPADPLMVQLAAAAGYTTEEAVVLRAKFRNDFLNFVCVPTRVWHREDERLGLLQLRREAADYGLRCIVVPQRWLRAEIRAATARMISRSLAVGISFGDRETVLRHVGETGFSDLGTCCRLVAHLHDPVGSVLSLVGHGFVTVDRTRPLGERTLVRLRISDPQ